jgi:hypothetical protein
MNCSPRLNVRHRRALAFLKLNVAVHRLPDGYVLYLPIAAENGLHHPQCLGFRLIETEDGYTVGVMGIVGNPQADNPIPIAAEMTAQ